MKKKRYVMGMGNYSKDDDGIGLHVIEYITANNLDDTFEAIEIANDGMKMLTFFTDETDKIVIVDCALMGKEPGHAEVFGVDDVNSVKNTTGITTHEGDILKLVSLAREVGYPVPDIRIVAIEPESLGLDMRLSKTLSDRLESYVELTLSEIRK